MQRVRGAAEYLALEERHTHYYIRSGPLKPLARRVQGFMSKPRLWAGEVACTTSHAIVSLASLPDGRLFVSDDVGNLHEYHNISGGNKLEFFRTIPRFGRTKRRATQLSAVTDWDVLLAIIGKWKLILYLFC